MRVSDLIIVSACGLLVQGCALGGDPEPKTAADPYLKCLEQTQGALDPDSPCYRAAMRSESDERDKQKRELQDQAAGMGNADHDLQDAGAGSSPASGSTASPSPDSTSPHLPNGR